MKVSRIGVTFIQSNSGLLCAISNSEKFLECDNNTVLYFFSQGIYICFHSFKLIQVPGNFFSTELIYI